MGSEIIHYLKNEIENRILPDNILFFIMEYAYWRL